MSNNPDVLEINVAEEIKIRDIPPGGAAPLAPPTGKETEAELKEKKEKAIAEMNRLNGLYVEPHKVKSRWVVAADLPRIISDGRDMAMMCSVPKGIHRSALAIAHPQITDKDPLRFFMFPDGKAIINPVIINHTKAHCEKEQEGCMSYAGSRPKTLVPRFNKVIVMYQTLGVRRGEKEPSLTPPMTEDFGGEMAHIFQHEISHFHGVYVYDDTYTAESCEGIGNGLINEEDARKMYAV